MVLWKMLVNRLEKFLSNVGADSIVVWGFELRDLSLALRFICCCNFRRADKLDVACESTFLECFGIDGFCFLKFFTAA